MHINSIQTSATKKECTLKQESFSASHAQKAPSLTRHGPLSAQAAQVFTLFDFLSYSQAKSTINTHNAPSWHSKR